MTTTTLSLNETYEIYSQRQILRSAEPVHVLSFVMAGGRGTRLKILTKDNCKPAVSILGRYRIFDFVASNIANTGIAATLVATQFRQATLSEHIGNGEAWGFDGYNRKIEIVCAHENGGNAVTFEGTADSVRKSAYQIDRYNPNIVLVLGSDHVYNMDYRQAIAQHEVNNADITIMTNVVPDSKVSDFGVVKIDQFGRIVDFAEKPTDREVIENFRLTPAIKNRLGITDPDLNFLASMGNYVFFWDRLKGFLDSPGVDFGKHIIPAIKDSSTSLYAYVFNGYWCDVGKVPDYFNCNMEFTQSNPPTGLPMRLAGNYEKLRSSTDVSAKSLLKNVILSPGDVIQRGSSITSSVLGRQVVVEEDCAIDHSIFLNANGNAFGRSQTGRGYTTRIGKGSNLSHVILDENVKVGKNVDIGPHNGTPEERSEILQSVGLKPYEELPDGSVEGDFYIEREGGILVMGKQSDADSRRPILPDGLRC